METVCRFLAVEPIHFSFRDIAARKEEYRIHGRLLRDLLHGRGLAEAEKTCVLVDDIPSHNQGVESLSLAEVLKQVGELEIVPDLCVYETSLRPIAIRIINTMPANRTRLDTRTLKLEVPFNRPIRLAVYSGNEDLARTNIDSNRKDIEPSCAVYILAWYYFVTRHEFDRHHRFLADIETLSVELNRPPVNQVAIILSGVYFHQEYRADLLAARSTNPFVQTLKSPIRIFYPASPIDAAEYAEL